MQTKRQKCLQGTNEQFGVAQTAKAVTVFQAHSSVLIQATFTSWRTVDESSRSVLAFFFPLEQ